MDIVERLRRTELHHVWDDLEGKMVGKMFSANPDGPEAADEIERLRKEVDELKDLMQATVNYTGASVSSTNYTFHAEQEDE
jgi:hypothetical protein